MCASDVISRRNNILRIVVEVYIDTASPVGSREISRRIDNSLSPATIRNVMADLEDMGLLTHPYTSAGRVPTEMGYRRYVDELMGESSLPEEERHKIEDPFKSGLKQADEAIAFASKMLSSLTNQMALISYPRLLEANLSYAGMQGCMDKFSIHFEGGYNVLNQPEFHDFHIMRSLFEILEMRSPIVESITKPVESREKEKVAVKIGRENGEDALSELSFISACYSAKDRPMGRLSLIGPMRMNYKKAILSVGCISQLLTDFFSQTPLESQVI